MDIDQSSDGKATLDASKLADYGPRKKKIGAFLHTIRKVSHGQLRSGAIDLDGGLPTDHNDVPEELRVDAGDLAQAVEYFYEGIWRELQDDLGLRFTAGRNPEFDSGRVFANFRGLAMAVRGIGTDADEERRDFTKELRQRNNIAEPTLSRSENEVSWKPSVRASSATLGPVDLFDDKSNESEVVLKSFFHFLEFMSPGASNRDWVGCGILHGRGILVSPLGSRTRRTIGAKVSVAKDEGLGSPIRFLILTKGEPDRRQLGRMLERICIMETKRLFSLKNLGLIENCFFRLRLITLQLDEILKFWSRRRSGLKEAFRPNESGDVFDADFDEFVAKAKSAYQIALRGRSTIFGQRDPYSKLEDAATSDVEHEFYEWLGKLNENIERKLIEINAELEVMGPKGSGHISYDIERAEFYAREFESMVDTLEIRNLHGWINYKQFADRGMRPTFNTIRATGARLRGAQERVKSLTDIIQVSGLLVQADATRRNTAELRKVAHNFNKANWWRFTSFGSLFVVGGVVVGFMLRGLIPRGTLADIWERLPF